MSLHPLPVQAAVGQVGMELPGELLVAHWCLRGDRTYQERNCCKGRLERNYLRDLRIQTVAIKNQREKTSKAVDHSNKQPGN